MLALIPPVSLTVGHEQRSQLLHIVNNVTCGLLSTLEAQTLGAVSQSHGVAFHCCASCMTARKEIHSKVESRLETYWRHVVNAPALSKC